MKIEKRHIAFVALFGLGIQAPLAVAQDNSFGISAASTSFRVAPSSALSGVTPVLSIERNVEEKDFQGALVEDALNFNLGVKVEPLPGFSVRADAWQMEVDEAPAASSGNSDWQGNLSQLYIQNSEIHQFNLDNPLLGTNVESNGFDLGASYVWETSKFGQFTLSTKASYVEEFENRGGLLELANTEIVAIEDRVISPELQSSLMLTWEFGNHSASAVTNYFDSFQDISELDLEEINDLVDNITTVDLQYGYSVKTGSNRAVISFGIRNIFDEKTAQILNANTRILDQNGRVAYGSIKYQF